MFRCVLERETRWCLNEFLKKTVHLKIAIFFAIFLLSISIRGEMAWEWQPPMYVLGWGNSMCRRGLSKINKCRTPVRRQNSGTPTHQTREKHGNNRPVTLHNACITSDLDPNNDPRRLSWIYTDRHYWYIFYQKLSTKTMADPKLISYELWPLNRL